ncbi:SLC26A/SulP transporter domain [Phytophthora cactorum]|nr:SLC26A/SulP transporter domain [Phytophthora cactorum]
MLIAKETADPTSLQARQHFALDARSPLPGRVTGFAMAPSAFPPSPSSDELSLSCLGALLSSLWTSACESQAEHNPAAFDLVSGITVGLMLVPQEVSLSAIMGVPPIYGLYTAAVVPMIYPLFANGAEVSLLVGSAIKKVESEEERIATVVLLFMGVFRLGVIADFFSRPVMGALSRLEEDLPVLTVWDLFQHFPELNGLSFAVGTFSIMVLVGMHELKRRVVKELARVEEEFEDQFAIETSRALTQLSMSVNSAGGEQGDMSEDDEDSQGAKDDRRAASYEGDIELGDAPKPKKRQPRKNDDEVDVEDLPAVFTTGSLRRRDYVLSSPWGSSGRNSRDLGSNDLDLARSCRQRDLAAITRNNRNGRLDDEGVGFSLSDEDYITIERPLDFGTRPDGAGASGMPRSSSDETGSARPLPRMNPTQPKVERPRRNDNNADNDDDSEAKAELK